MDPKWSPNQAKNEQSGAESGHLGQDLDTGLGILARISVSGPGSGHVDQDPGIWATFWARIWASGQGSGHLGGGLVCHGLLSFAVFVAQLLLLLMPLPRRRR